MNQKIQTCFLAGVFVLMISACSKKTTPPAESKASNKETLFLYKWNIKELNGKSVTSSPLPYLTFSYDPDMITGFGGCNNFSAAYKINGTDSILFGKADIASKKCPNSNIESQLLKIFKTADRWSVTSKELYLYHGTAVLAIFAGETPGTKSSVMLNGVWELEYITGPKIAFDSLYPGEKPFLTLDVATAKATGNSSCNSFNTTFKLTGNALTFDYPASTRMACPGNGEAVFFNALAMSNNYRFENDLLEFRKGEEVIMRFHRKH